MHFCARIAVGMFALTSAHVACAATVEVTQAQLSLDNGSGFKGLTASTAAKPGDRVMAGAKGYGRVVYDDGCVVNVQPGKIVVIAAKSPCASKAGSAGGGAGTAAGTTAASLAPYAIGAAVIGGGVAAAVVLSDSNSASP